MRTGVTIFLLIACLAGCSKAPLKSESIPSDQFGTNLCPVDGISIQKSTDGLERTIAIRDDWLGNRYGPLRLVCESSSIERLLDFVANGPQKHFSNVIGSELLPPGTYRYDFRDKKWDDRDALLKDVLNATSETFGLTFEISNEQGKKFLLIKPKKDSGFQTPSPKPSQPQRM